MGGMGGISPSLHYDMYNTMLLRGYMSVNEDWWLAGIALWFG